jgi:hypothetical protein
MWNPGHHDHCSEEQLLLFADGELPDESAASIESHLRVCRPCRSKLEDLKETLDAVGHAASRAYPGPAQTARIRGNLLARIRDEQRRSASSPKPARRSAKWVYVAATAAVVVLAFALTLVRQLNRAGPQAVLEQARGTEVALSTSPLVVHQVVSVEMTQLRPAAHAISGKLELWSDKSGGRYASRWTDAGGAIRYASWKVSQQDSWEFGGDPAAPIARIETKPLAQAGIFDVSQSSLAELQSAFVMWLRSRPWQPLEMSGNFATFVGPDGTTVRMERSVAPDGSPILRLTAKRQMRSVNAEFALVVDAGTYRAKLQVMRFESGAGAVEIRLAMERSETVRPELLHAAVFEPRLPGIRQATELPARGASIPLPHASAAELDNLEVRVLAALHRAKACRSEIVEVRTNGADRLRVHGIVAEERRKFQIEALLKEIPGSAAIDFDIQTGAPPKRASTATAQLPEGAAQALDDMYIEALSLVRLAERFNRSRATTLEGESHKMLDAMLADHVNALGAATARARGLLSPELAADNGAESGAFAGVPGRDWNAECFSAFRKVDGIDEVLQGPAFGATAAPEQRKAAIAEVQSRFQELSLDLNRFRTAFVAVLPGEDTSAHR